MRVKYEGKVYEFDLGRVQNEFSVFTWLARHLKMLPLKWRVWLSTQGLRQKGMRVVEDSVES